MHQMTIESEANTEASAVPSTAAPVSETDRIVALDALRGFAILGILIMNIQSFSMIDAAYFNPSAYGSLQGIHGIVAALSAIFADQKFMTLFSIMFGAGVLLMTQRTEAKGLKSRRVHYRRMLVLLLFGLIHAYLLWHGDVLVVYAMCGMIIYPLRKRSPRTLIILSLVGLATASLLLFFSGWSMPFWPPEVVEEYTHDWLPPPDMVEAELDAFRGGIADQLPYRAPRAFQFETFVFLIWGLWRAGGLMLLGMALFKLGVLSAARSTRFYVTLVLVAVFIGVPAASLQWWLNQHTGWPVGTTFFKHGQINYWASILISLGYAGAIMLACKAGVAFVTRWLAPVGRMALSNYLGQTIICTLLFYGHGLGMFGKVDRGGQILVVLAVWALQIIVSSVWLRHFIYGPFEWAWRSLTYGRCQPFRRTA